jgi:hypothetical protein
MNTLSTFLTGKGSTASERGAKCGCDIDIRIDCRGDVNIYNCTSPGGTGPSAPPDQPPCFPPSGACLPVVPGAKHKLSRDYKLAKLAERVRVPSSLAAGAMHLTRRFLLGKAAANPLEAAAFATLGRMSRDILSCTVAAFDAVPARQRARLFAPSLILDPNQPIDEATLAAALAQEIVQRIGVQVFDDPQGADQERPGRMRVYEPQGEDFFSQVRICTVNGLRTANFIPPIATGDYLPAEIQQDCEPKIVDGQPQVVCEVRTTDCPGNSLGSACARVLDIALGDGVVLEGVNYFSVEAKVRFTDTQTGTAVRDVEAHVWGDVDTPVTEVVNGETILINDCRVHDRLTFQVPNDLAPAIYQINVVVPNITGISAFGSELISNSEFINVIPPATARFQIVTEQIRARKETSPEWLGSDEVGLHTLAFPLFADGTFGTDEAQRTEQKFKDIQDVDFDTGTQRDITRAVFKHDQPILGLVMSVRGDEIDSQRAYDQEITSSTDFFIDLVKEQAQTIGSALLALGGISALTKLGLIGAIIAGIAALITVGIDIIVALWAPADPIIRDSIGLSVTDLATLTSANGPAPDPATFKTEDDITVNVNKTIPPQKLPTQYTETREYVSDDQDSRYEITYRFIRVA